MGIKITVPRNTLTSTVTFLNFPPLHQNPGVSTNIVSNSAADIDIKNKTKKPTNKQENQKNKKQKPRKPLKKKTKTTNQNQTKPTKQTKNSSRNTKFSSLIYSYFLVIYLTSIPLLLQSSRLNQCHVFHMQLAGMGSLPMETYLPLILHRLSVGGVILGS